MIEIFRGSYLEAMVIRNLLENNAISVFVQNEYMSSINPWTVTAGGYDSLSLQINEVDLVVAKLILEKYDNGDYNLD